MQEGEKPIIDLSRLKGKICFVGLSALGSHDTSPVPIQAVYPMMGLYANVLNSILLEDYLWRLGRAGNLLIVLVLGAWILYASSRLKPLRALLAVLATVAAFSGAAVAAFFWTGLWVDLFYPLTLFTVIYAASTLTRTLFEIRKRELIEGELKIASKIQKSFLPETLPQVPGIQFEVFMKPAKHVGGDLYAFIPLPEGRIGVMLGDVSGKGTPAALFMAKVVSEFKFSARDKSDPAQVLTALNNSIASESTGGLFVTLTYVIFDMPNKKLLLANGGHLPTVHVGPGGDGLISGEEGMPIGVMEGVSFSNLERGIADGDCFALYSDGVSEARNRRKDEYGVETLQAQMARRRGGTAKEILDGAVADLQRFTAKADQHDDITLLIIRVGNP
jgi:serine phosphatase RsbU (regulator of sigma subunit)